MNPGSKPSCWHHHYSFNDYHCHRIFWQCALSADASGMADGGEMVTGTCVIVLELPLSLQPQPPLVLGSFKAVMQIFESPAMCWNLKLCIHWDMGAT